MKKLIIYLIVSLVLVAVAIILGQYSFPSDDGQPYGRMIRIRQDNIMHSSSSLPAFRRYWNAANHLLRTDTVLRIAVISVNETDQKLTDDLIHELREAVNDPRLEAKWNWSRNWTSAAKAEDEFIFSRPSVAVNTESASPQHDFTEAWVECASGNQEPKKQITVFCKNDFPEISTAFICDSNTIVESEMMVSGGWQCLHFPFEKGNAQLNIRGENSPVIGNITIEPVSGFSIWSLRIPGSKHSSAQNKIRMQTEVLNPGMLILVSEKSNPEEIRLRIRQCRKLFGNKPMLVYSSGIQHEKAEAAWLEGAAFLSGSQTACIKLVLRKEIRRLLKTI